MENPPIRIKPILKGGGSSMKSDKAFLFGTFFAVDDGAVKFGTWIAIRFDFKELGDKRHPWL